MLATVAASGAASAAPTANNRTAVAPHVVASDEAIVADEIGDEPIDGGIVDEVAVKGRRGLSMARALWQAREDFARAEDTAPGRLVPDRSLHAGHYDGTSGVGVSGS